MKECTKEEFTEFVTTYPRELVLDFCAIGEPPTLSYNDPTLGQWPQCVVASCKVLRCGEQKGWKIANLQQSTE